MGIIKRQGIKQSIVTYLGILIGMVNMLWVYPSFLTTQELGLIKFLQSTTVFLLPFVFLGSSNLLVRYFPEFKNKAKKHHGFLFFSLLLLTVGIGIFLAAYFLGRAELAAYFSKRGEGLVVQYLPHLVILTCIAAFSHLFTTYTLNFKRIVVPSIFNDLFIKIAIPALVILYYLSYFNFTELVNGMLWAYGLVLIALIFYVKNLGELHLRPDFSLLNMDRLRRMFNYMGYGLLSSTGSKLANQIDILMVTSLSSLSNAGIYALAMTISTVIEVPRRALTKIIQPILTEALQNKDMAEVKMLYQKSALTQFIAGLFIFLGIWASVDELFAMMPKGAEFATGKYVIFFLGLSKLVDMSSGINAEIIVLSKYYRYQAYFVLCLAIFNVGSNLLWIPIFEINGAALATFSSMFLFNLLKFILVKRKFNIQPFTKATFWVLLMGLFTYLMVYLLPETSNIFLNIFINSVMVTVIFGGLVLYFKPSKDINDLIINFWNKGINYLK